MTRVLVAAPTRRHAAELATHRQRRAGYTAAETLEVDYQLAPPELWVVDGRTASHQPSRKG